MTTLPLIFRAISQQQGQLPLLRGRHESAESPAAIRALQRVSLKVRRERTNPVWR
jgi:hypothetical protein